MAGRARSCQQMGGWSVFGETENIPVSPYNGTNGTSNKWTEAKSILETVIANGTDSKGTKYTLTPSYETLYTAGESDWTGESVFDVQMAISVRSIIPTRSMVTLISHCLARLVPAGDSTSLLMTW